MSSSQKVVLFGGQGSSHLFSSSNTSTAVADSKSSAAAATLLSRCHAAFLKDLRLLTSTKSIIFGDTSGHFLSPETLLSPDPQFHDNPVVQGTTLALHQLLRYLSYTDEPPYSYDKFWHHIEEVAGFCSGILPAAVVCASESIDQYIDYATEAFRLSLWTGYRSASYCERLLGGPRKNLAWSLVINGLDKEEVCANLEQFRRQVSFSCELFMVNVMSHTAISGTTLPLNHSLSLWAKRESSILNSHGYYYSVSALGSCVKIHSRCRRIADICSRLALILLMSLW